MFEVWAANVLCMTPGVYSKEMKHHLNAAKQVSSAYGQNGAQ